MFFCVHEQTGIDNGEEIREGKLAHLTGGALRGSSLVADDSIHYLNRQANYAQIAE